MKAPLICCALLFAACGQRVADPEELTLPALPNRFDAAQDTRAIEVDAKWWTQFGAEELDRAVEASLNGNLTLQSAHAALRGAEAAAQAAGAARWPTASAGLQSARSRQNFIGLPIPGAGDVLPVTSTNHGLSLNLSWEIDLWGRIDAAVEAAEAELLASQAQLAAVQLSIAGQTARSWLAARETELQLELIRAQEEIARQQVDHLRLRFESGSARAAQLLAAEQGHDRWRTERTRLEISLDQQQRALQLLAGQFGTGEAEAASSSLAALPSLGAPLAAGLPVDLLARRPDLAEAEALYYAGAAREREARTALYPRLALTASGGTASNDLGDLLDGDFRVWSFAAGLTAPLFEGGRLRAQRDARIADRERLAWQFAQTLLTAVSEVEATLTVESLLKEQHRNLRRSRERAEQQAALAKARYQSGSGSLLEWLEARSAALEAASRETNAHLLLLQNRVDLYLALGGGFSHES